MSGFKTPTSDVSSNVLPFEPTPKQSYVDKIIKRYFKTVQDWLALLGILIALAAFFWAFITYTVDGRLSAIEKQNAANYEKLSAEQREQAAATKSDFLELKGLIQDVSFKQKIAEQSLRK